jgi:hypothetical protein
MVDDERWTPGMPVLERQEVPIQRDVQGRPLVPSRVPETKPTPLQPWFIYLSIVVLVCGTIAITLSTSARPSGAAVRRRVLGDCSHPGDADAALRIALLHGCRSTVAADCSASFGSDRLPRRGAGLSAMLSCWRPEMPPERGT